MLLACDEMKKSMSLMTYREVIIGMPFALIT